MPCTSHPNNPFNLDLLWDNLELRLVNFDLSFWLASNLFWNNVAQDRWDRDSSEWPITAPNQWLILKHTFWLWSCVVLDTILLPCHCYSLFFLEFSMCWCVVLCHTCVILTTSVLLSRVNNHWIYVVDAQLKFVTFKMKCIVLKTWMLKLLIVVQ